MSDEPGDVPAPAEASSEPASGIVLNAWPGFSWIGVQRWRLVVELDGVQRKGVWRKQTFHLPPGDHPLSIWYTRRLLPGAPISPASADVVVGIGEMIRVRYRPGFFRGSLGRLSVEETGA